MIQPVNFLPPRLPAVIVIGGPTASGKTGLAVRLAEMTDGEVVSADSMQIYREMNIGTAKPTVEEMRGIPHHLIDFLPPDRDYSVAAFLADADRAIGEVFSRGKRPIVCGGTGQYLHALLHNLQLGGTGADDALRDRLRRRLAQEGADSLYEELRRLDPASAEGLHKNNTVRLVRALELALTGAGKTANNLASHGPKKYDFCMLALNYADRGVLYDRINRRVALMFDAGLTAEAEALRSRYGVTARAAIGYKELEAYFNGTATLPECADRICAVTRNYAKRQLTWLRSFPAANWIYPDRCDAVRQAEKILANFGLVL